MAKTVEIYYSFQSPFSYLALDKLYEMEKLFNVDFIWQPFSAKASGQQLNSLQIIPEKLSYFLESAKRYAKDQNITLSFPSAWPKEEYDPIKVTRGAIVARDMGVLMEYNYKVFHKVWGLGENPNTDIFFNELCEEIDVDLGEFIGKMTSSDTKERVKNIYKRGKSYEVFDTPTLVIDGERFVGIDVLDYVKERLAKNKK